MGVSSPRTCGIRTDLPQGQSLPVFYAWGSGLVAAHVLWPVHARAAFPCCLPTNETRVAVRCRVDSVLSMLPWSNIPDWRVSYTPDLEWPWLQIPRSVYLALDEPTLVAPVREEALRSILAVNSPLSIALRGPERADEARRGRIS